MSERLNFQRNKYKNVNNQLSKAQINQRLKNISLTKRLISYERYINAVPKKERSENLKNDWHPETPRIDKKLSLSQWNKEMKKWRKQVHAWGNISDEVHRYICSLSTSEKNDYLSKLKLPELSQIEINNLKKRNEELSDKTLKNILLISENTNNYNEHNNKIIDIPILFLPQNFSGTIINNEFIIIRQDYLEKSLISLKDYYTKKYEHLFEKYYCLYLMPNDYNLRNGKESKIGENDIVIYLTKKKQVQSNYPLNKKDQIIEYIRNQKIEASKYLHFSDVTIKNNYEKQKKKGFMVRF
ncbi:histone RNA hairpin-binding protein, putative [Plasmodium malariae]|uniref:Histone RNA hairpin-binding protein, putative n=2 Tax=Plasmodium (Plasmodium) TaxID=418103 RepID=A0A1A8WQK2_PLAMA|nr:histone RNA hairpin-binding protein, putative [Plasmodium malariae]SBS94131.1 hypothetical protein PMALA_042210 [Plasmodium malariae]SCN44807.1 histone RNA hairpin-binding protein, putative [Plasmodium malariae]